MNMMSNCDVTNSAHQIQMTTICHVHRRTGRRFTGEAEKSCPENNNLKLTFLVWSKLGLKPLENLFYIVEFVYNGFVCNINSPITLHFVRARWHLLHAFQFAYNFNSAITFFMQSPRGAAKANSVVTLLVNSRGWSSLRVVFSLTRNFTVIAFTAWIYCIETFFTFPWETELPWNFPLCWIYFLPLRIFEQLEIALKNRVCPEYFYCVEYIFFIIQDFWATCACPEKQSLPWIFSLYWNIFYHSGFLSNLRLPWETEFPWKF